MKDRQMRDLGTASSQGPAGRATAPDSPLAGGHRMARVANCRPGTAGQAAPAQALPARLRRPRRCRQAAPAQTLPARHCREGPSLKAKRAHREPGQTASGGRESNQLPGALKPGPLRKLKLHVQ
jgi:hypothetical protein